MKSENFNNLFMPLVDYLQEAQTYLSKEAYEYLSKLKETHVVLKKNTSIYFDDPAELDEVFSETLILPKYQTNNLKYIIENKVIGLNLESTYNSMYPYEYNYEYDMKSAFIALSTVRDNLYLYPTISIQFSNKVCLIGRDGQPLITKTNAKDSAAGSTLNQTTSVSINIPPDTVNELRDITLYSDANDVKIKDTSSYVANKFFSEEDLLLLSESPKKVVDQACNMAIIKDFADLVTSNLYKKALNGTLSRCLDGIVEYKKDGYFTYTYRGVSFEGKVCYDIATSKLLLASFEAPGYEGSYRFISHVEQQLVHVLKNLNVQVSNQLKNLGSLVSLLNKVATKELEKFLSTLDDKQSLLSKCIREYPIDFLQDSLGTILNKCLLDSLPYAKI